MASCGRVRVVARIKGHAEADSVPVSRPWVVVSRPDENPNPNPNPSCRVKISFSSTDQTTGSKQSYEVDECYEQDVNNEGIFDREVKPLISGLFGGQNSTVFAYGPRGSGKTYTIQGHERQLGLAVLTVNSIMPRAGEEGKDVTVSVFEMYQDRITDLLDPKGQEVSVFEDAQGKIRLKGISKVKVSSIEEFQTLYFAAANMRKQTHHQSHTGCIIHVVSPKTENSRGQLVGKINFIDLASHEDSRRKSSDNSNMNEATRIKKSLNAVQNVLYALNAYEKRIPYRECKLTRMLQDSLGGTSRTLMLTCMNSFFCQETVQTISLASRACIASFLACLDLGKSGRTVNKTMGKSSPQIQKSASKTSLRTNMMSSPQIQKSASKTSLRTNMMSSPQIPKSGSKSALRTNMMSPKIMKPTSCSASGRKQAGSLLKMSMRKASGGVAVEAKGKKLFVETNQMKNSELENVCPLTASAMERSAQTEEDVSLESEAAVESSTQQEVNVSLESMVTVESSTQEEEKSTVTASSNMDSSQLRNEKEKFVLDSDTSSSQLLREDVIEEVESSNNVLATPSTCKTPTTGNFLIEDKENKLSCGPSPPLSTRLRELSNNLKSLCISTEANLKKTQEHSTLFDQVMHENLDPRTPSVQPGGKAHDKYDITASPWEAFHMRSSGMKESFVRESLKFLNTASKEELKKLKGIGEKRATYILELREESPEPFKELDDLSNIGLSSNQIKAFMKNVGGNLFS